MKSSTSRLFLRSNSRQRNSLPVRLFVIVLVTVFLGEALAMSLVFRLPNLSEPLIALLDAFILVTLLLPPLYFLLFLPMRREISERKQDQSQLSLLYEILDRLFSSTHILLAYMDTDFRFIRVNRAFAEADQKDPEDFEGKNHFELYPSEENERIFQKVLATGEPVLFYSKPFSTHYAHNRGISYWDWILDPIKDEHGKVEGVLLSLFEVTERKKAEEQIQRHSQELAFLNKVSAKTSSSLELPEMLTAVRDLFAEQSVYPAGVIYTYDPSSQELVPEISWGMDGGRRLENHRFPVSLEPYRQVVEEVETRQVKRVSVQHSDILADRTAGLPDDGSTCIYIPLTAHGELQGLMELIPSTTENTPGQADAFYQAIGLTVGKAIHNTDLYAKERASYEKAEVLRQAGLALTQSLDLQTVMQALLEFTGRLVPYDRASVMLVEDEEHLNVTVGPASSLPQPAQREAWVRINREENRYIDQVISGQKGIWIADLALCEDWKRLPWSQACGSWLGAPLFAGDKVIGLCSLEKDQPGFYSAEHLALAEALASQAAVAVQNSWLFSQLNSGRERLQALSRQLVEIQENERGYIARELHDQAGQMLTSLKVGLRLLERDAEQPQAVLAGTAQLKGLTDRVLDDLHRLAKNLRPASLDQLGLVDALRHYAQQVSHESGLTVQFEAMGIEEGLPKSVEINLYRIIQEAVTNAVRHAQASWVSILLEKQEHAIVALVEDNGTGFDPTMSANSGRLGLLGMRERAEMLGGKLQIETGEHQGTTIYVEVPDADVHLDRG